MLLKWLMISSKIVIAIALITTANYKNNWFLFCPANIVGIGLAACSSFDLRKLEKEYEGTERREDTLAALEDAQVEGQLNYLEEKVANKNLREQKELDLDNEIQRLTAIAPLYAQLMSATGEHGAIDLMGLAMMQNGAPLTDVLMAQAEAKMQWEQAKLVAAQNQSQQQSQIQQIAITQPISQSVTGSEPETEPVQINQSANLIDKAAGVNNLKVELVREDVAPSYKRLIYSYRVEDFQKLANWKQATKLALGVGDTEPLPMYIYGSEQIAVEIPLPDSERKFYDFPDRKWRKGGRLIVLGQSLDGEIVIDLGYEDTPQILVAGTTGSGKTNFIRSAIYALLEQGNRVDICGGKVSDYEDFAESYDSISMKDMSLTAQTVSEYYQECDRRNSLGKAELSKEPGWILLIDEYKGTVPIDPFAAKTYDTQLAEVTRRGRGLKIHVIIGLQRGSKRSKDDRQGLPADLKDNLVCRIAFRMVDPTGSRLILPPGERGGLAASLKGRGDGIVHAGALYTRFQAYKFEKIPE